MHLVNATICRWFWNGVTAEVPVPRIWVIRNSFYSSYKVKGLAGKSMMRMISFNELSTYERFYEFG